MKEADLRKGHRYLGIWLAFFIVLQAGSGALISAVNLVYGSDHDHAAPTGDAGIAADRHEHGQPPPPVQPEEELPQWLRIIMAVHTGNGFIGNTYRLVIGLGFIGMAVSGALIFLKIKQRSKS